MSAINERVELCKIRLAYDKVSAHIEQFLTDRSPRKRELLDGLAGCREALQGDIDHLDEHIRELKASIQAQMRRTANAKR